MVTLKTAMKKLLILFTFLGMFTLSCSAGPGSVQTLINQYRHNEGFEHISMGPLALSLVKGAVLLDGPDQEAVALLNAFRKIRKVSILNFEDASDKDKERFVEHLGKILEGMELILEAKDEGDRLSIYGVDEGGRIRDCVLYDPSGTLICVRGTLNLEQLLALEND